MENLYQDIDIVLVLVHSIYRESDLVFPGVWTFNACQMCCQAVFGREQRWPQQNQQNQSFLLTQVAWRSYVSLGGPGGVLASTLVSALCPGNGPPPTVFPWPS